MGDARAMGVVGAIASLCVGTNEFVRAVTRDGGDDSRASDAMARVMTMGRSVGALRCPARRARRGARRELARGDRRTNRRGVDVAREAMDEADARALDDGSRSTLAFDFRAHEACVRAALVAAGSRDDAAAAEATKTTTTKTNETLGVTTTTEVWSTSRFRRVRSTYVDGGELAQIYNCVVYPSPAACDAPMLGVDLISLGKGEARKVLIGVDLHPMSRDREYASAYVPALEALRRGPGKVADAAAALGATTPSKKFYRDATFFSRGIFFARPERADEETMTRSLDVVRAYVDAWTARLDEAEREAEAMDGACKFGLALEDVRRCVLTKAAARAAQDAYDAWQLAHDPAIPMFAKWYGEEWAREFAETVLFPGARERLASS
jgi:15,16-dihydrobiliverdin:ferredoxin oxidoreductase